MARTVLMMIGIVGCTAGVAIGQNGAPPAASPRTAPESAKSQQRTLADYLRSELDTAMNAAREGGKPADALKRVNALFDIAVVHLPLPGDAETLRAVAVARRLLTQVTTTKNDAGLKLLPMLIDNKALASAVALSVRPDDDVVRVYTLLADLNEKFPKQLADEKFANLAAAVCVVFDKPPAHPVLANTKQSYPAVDSAEVFNYFTTNAARMQFPLATTPVDLLANVVNIAVSPEEMNWALQNYAGNRTVGKLYDSITYDTDVLKKTSHDDKKVFKQPGGFTLQNIKKVGGVCEEQAFFASQVGKSIGVPTAYVFARGNDLSHAYVGYLRTDGPRWDFTEGQSDEYKELEGLVIDPQTGQTRPSTVGAVTALLASTKPEDRQRAIALTDGALRLGAGARPALASDLPESTPASKGKPRAAGIEDQLALLDQSVKLAPGYLPAWEQVVALAKDKKLPENAKRVWADSAMRVAGRQYPDFAMWVIAPLIQSIESVEQQSSMWESMSGQFGQRRDLAARCKFEQGDAWTKADKPDNAFAAYKQIVERFTNDGRMAMQALERIEALMQSKGAKGDALIPIYENAFRRISKPGTLAPAQHRRTSYYLVGSRLADLFEDAGKQNEADRVRRMIDTDKGDKKGLKK